MVNAPLRRQAAAGDLFSKFKPPFAASGDKIFPPFLRTHQRDLNFSPAQPALSNAKRRAARPGAVFGHGAGKTRGDMGAWGMIGIDQTGRRAPRAIAAAI